MAMLIQIPILHTMGDVTQGLPEHMVKRDLSLVQLLNEHTTRYWQWLIPSFMSHLKEAGLIDRKGRFTRPAHVFLDGLWRPGHELIWAIRRHKLDQKAQAYELVTRLCAARAVLQKTELKCLLGKKITSDEQLGLITKLRDTYAANRIERILLAEPNVLGIFIIGAGHPRLTLPSPIEVKVFHRADLWPERFLREFFGNGAEFPMCVPDDFGHAAGYR